MSESFVVPPKDNLRTKYTLKTTANNKPGTWTTTDITIQRNNSDGTVDDVFSYQRNYALMKTFEPFRQLKDGVWREYALISSKYTRFEVVDLELGKIIATEAYPKMSQQEYDKFIAQGYTPLYKVGEDKVGSSFCPVEFKVFDWYELFAVENIDSSLFEEEEFLRVTGNWALYSGCVWGDDSGGWKLRYIDLSRISEGIVTSEEKFGYLQLASELSKVEYDAEVDMFTFPVELNTYRESGKSYPIQANWEEK